MSEITKSLRTAFSGEKNRKREKSKISEIKESWHLNAMYQLNCNMYETQMGVNNSNKNQLNFNMYET